MWLLPDRRKEMMKIAWLIPKDSPEGLSGPGGTQGSRALDIALQANPTLREGYLFTQAACGLLWWVCGPIKVPLAWC